VIFKKSKKMTEHPFIKYKPKQFSAAKTEQRSGDFFEYMDTRRSIRDYSEKPVPKNVIQNLIMTASTAPSGAHKQPWTFCAISDSKIKSEIRKAAEEEEYTNYHGRMSEEWLRDLAPLQTDWRKEFLETAPWLIIIFKKVYDIVGGEKRKNYYVNESVGIAAGFLLGAIHNAGLVSLTHTPRPMNFLQKVLNRPENERPFLLVPVGYPAAEVEVPDLERKGAEDVVVYY